MLAPTCFGSSLPSLGSFWIRLSYVKNTDRYGGLSYNVVKWPVCRSVEVQSVVLPSSGANLCIVLVFSTTFNNARTVNCCNTCCEIYSIGDHPKMSL
jgi:hypothetical protein